MIAAGKSFTGDKKAKVTSLLSKPRLTDAVSGKGLVSGTDYVAAFKYEIAGSADGPSPKINPKATLNIVALGLILLYT